MNQNQLINWYQTPSGKEYAKLEHEQLAQQLTKLPGNHLLQLGSCNANWLSASRIMYKCILDPTLAASPSVVAAYDELPFPHEFFDIVILPHVLELSANYPNVLREAARVTAGEGRLVILGFNPYSLCALSKSKLPIYNLLNVNKLRYWLKQSNCEIEQINTFFFRPLVQHEKLLTKLAFMEKLGQFCCPGLGSGYLIIARKKIEAMLPLNQRIRNWWRVINSKPLAEPTTRNKS